MASQQKNHFFLPIVIALLALLYFIWPKQKSEVGPVLSSVEVTQTAKTSPPPSPAARSVAQVTPTAETLATHVENTRLSECWKKIHQQMADADKTEPEGKFKSRRYRRFTRTLAKAGLLDDPKIKQNPDQALRRLDRMARRDPQNSAPLLFSAAIEYQRGNTLKAQQILAQARTQTTKFDSYFKSYTQEMLGQVSNPSELVTAYEKLSKAKIPNYGALQKMLVDMNQPELARQMMADGLDENKSMTDVDWVPIEYASGRSVLKALGEEQPYPEYKDLQERKKNSNSLYAEKLHEQLEKDCDLNALAPFVEQLQKELHNRK